MPLGILSMAYRSDRCSTTASCSPSLEGCPMFGMTAVSPTMTAVSSVKQQSGKSARAGSTVTSVPCARRAAT